MIFIPRVTNWHNLASIKGLEVTTNINISSETRISLNVL